MSITPTCIGHGHNHARMQTRMTNVPDTVKNKEIQGGAVTLRYVYGIFKM